MVGESNVRKEQNGRESLRRLNPTGGCNASERRRRRRRLAMFRIIEHEISTLSIILYKDSSISTCKTWIPV